MFALSSTLQYFFYYAPTDMRKSFDGLCGLVHGELGRMPISGEVFVFVNRQRDKIKLLHWEHGGFVLYYKRLEKGTFEMPKVDPLAKTCQISWSSLVLILEGISIEKTKKRTRYLSTNSKINS